MNMPYTDVWDTIYLFLLGFAGWTLFSILRLPVAPLLGTLTLITILRVSGVMIPHSPSWLFPLVQILIGIRVGSMVTRETHRNFKQMMAPAVIIILWVYSVIYLLGPLLSWVTTLDLHTAILSLSMGGVTEITILSLATEADTGFVILMQLIRLFVTLFLFPLILSKWIGKRNNTIEKSEKLTSRDPSIAAAEKAFPGGNYIDSIKEKMHSTRFMLTKILVPGIDKPHGNLFKNRLNNYTLKNSRPIGRGTLTFLIASAGGSIFHYLGVPAGFMIGAAFAIAITSLAGVGTMSIPPGMFNLILVGAGISVADNILPERFTELTDPRLLIPIALATVIIFISSFLISLLIHRISGRDLPTCFLAAAPAGFTVMTVLAIKYDKDPLFVSMLQLCRILSIKIVVPIVFMYLM